MSTLNWHGGKTYLAKQIISMIPDHTHYVETHFGGGAVFFRKPDHLIKNHSEVINDIMGQLMNWWAVVRSPKLVVKLQQELLSTPFSESLWHQAKTLLGNRDWWSGKPSIKQAAQFFVKYRQSRQGMGNQFATPSKNRTRRGMNEQVSSYLSAIEGLMDAHERLRRVKIRCGDAVKIIKEEDGPNTFFYCDPPYLRDTRVAKDVYEHEMTNKDHELLLSTLSQIKGKFLLSGYNSVLYSKFQKENGWNRIDIEIDNKASSSKKKPRVVECLWSGK